MFNKFQAPLRHCFLPLILFGRCVLPQANVVFESFLFLYTVQNAAKSKKFNVIIFGWFRTNHKKDSILSNLYNDSYPLGRRNQSGAHRFMFSGHPIVLPLYSDGSLS